MPLFEAWLKCAPSRRSIIVITCDILTRREIEACLIAPLLEAFAEEVGRERAIEIVRQEILHIARQQGAELAQEAGGRTLAHFAAALDSWKRGNAMDMDVLEQSDERLAFNVTRCGYAEMYRQLGIPELGQILSCGRDFAMIEGFNPDINLTRTQTILEGAPNCNFRYQMLKPAEDKV